MKGKAYTNKPSGRLSKAPKRPLLKEGTYQALITSWDPHTQFGVPKILLQLTVFSNEGETDLTYFANIKIDEDGEIMEPASTTSLAKLLRNVFPNKSFSEINLNDLINLSCMVEVGTVTKDFSHQPHPPDKQYSKIREIYRQELENSSADEYEGDDVPF